MLCSARFAILIVTLFGFVASVGHAQDLFGGLQDASESAEDGPNGDLATADRSTGTASEEPAETISVEQFAPDSAIENRLSTIFESTEWFAPLEVKSENGIVTLSGVANSVEHQKWAEAVARKTQDVVVVINKLNVEADSDFDATTNVIQDSLSSLWQEFVARSPLLAIAFIILIITALASKFAVFILRRVFDARRLRVSLKDLLYQLTSIAIWIIGFMIATVIAFPGMTPSKALTVLGLGSVAIGFAFKDIFENFFAGILILWGYPFDRGDFISCEGLTGRVEQITIRNTLIRKLDGELAVVPNGTLFKNNVDVLTSQPQRRVRIICGVAYGEDVDQSREIIRKSVQSCESIEGIRTVEVFAQEFASSSINFEVAWWTGSKPIDIRRSRDEVVAAIKRELDLAGIEIPFPYRTLTFKDPSVFSSRE